MEDGRGVTKGDLWVYGSELYISEGELCMSIVKLSLPGDIVEK